MKMPMKTREMSLMTSLLALAIGAGGCFQQDATRAEMRQALLETTVQGLGMGMESEIIELTTSFTIGKGVEAAFEELRDFVSSQVPCSTVTLEPGKLSIDFGDLADTCTYRGRTYAGVVTVELEAQGDSYLVTHTYDGLTGGTVTLDGTADVTWTGTTRNVVTDLSFVSDDRTVEVEADRTQVFSSCADATAVCVDIDGHRMWTGPAGQWDMSIAGVHIRSIDPVPESGTYTLLTPKDKEVEMSFARVDEDTIRVTLSSGLRSFDFDVTKSGAVSE